ncbi:MAG: tRNA dihydrouridine synthase DusB [Bacillota bacterium]
MHIGNIMLANRIITAPLAGVTDKAFREILKSMGPAMVCTEMVSDKALTYANKKTFELLNIEGEEHPICVQIFGSEPEVMAEAAAIVESKGADVIDINMGCPTPKIVKNGEGAALMRNPELAGKIVKAVVNSVSLPVTVKMRKGWDFTSVNALRIALRVEEAGAAAVTVHGRTREQLYGGKADWGIIAEVKKHVQIPVCGNGDVFHPEDALEMLNQTGCDGVMIGRGMLGNPWLVKRAVEITEGKPVSSLPEIEERITLALQHLAREVELKGESKGIRQMRKHLAWYTKGLKNAAGLRDEINKLINQQDIKEVLINYLEKSRDKGIG